MKGYEMNAAPERIWIKPTYLSDDPDDFYLANPKYLTGREAEYVLASRLAEVEAERDHFAREMQRMRKALHVIADSYDARSELYRDDTDLAAGLADRARAALNPEGEMP